MELSPLIDSPETRQDERYSNRSLVGASVMRLAGFAAGSAGPHVE